MATTLTDARRSARPGHEPLSQRRGQQRHLDPFDSLGRLSTAVKKLGTFMNTYVGVTNRLSKVAYPGGASRKLRLFPERPEQTAPADHRTIGSVLRMKRTDDSCR